MTIASLLQVIAQEASCFKVRPQDVFRATAYTGNAADRMVSNGLDTARGWGTGSPKTIQLNGGGTEYSTDSGATKTSSGFTLAGLSDGNHLYMAIRKDI